MVPEATAAESVAGSAFPAGGELVRYGITDPNVAETLRRFAASLELDLHDSDRAHVEALAARLPATPEGHPTTNP